MTGTWSSGGNLNSAKRYPSGFGTQNAGTVAGGYISGNTNITEEYNGSSWSSGGNLSVACHSGGALGSQTAGLYVGGYTTTHLITTEEYDGSTWSSGGNLSSARHAMSCGGTLAAGISMGGYAAGSPSNIVEDYDGTTWSSETAMNTAAARTAGCGTQNAALVYGGETSSPYVNDTQEFNGSSWSAGGDLSAAKWVISGCGVQSAALCFAGDTGSYTNVTEEYDGSAWSSGGNLSASKRGTGGCGSQSSALCMGGYTGSNTAITEEYIIINNWTAKINGVLNPTKINGIAHKDITKINGIDLFYKAKYDSTNSTYFSRRKKITINSSADGALTDYQIPLTIAYESEMEVDFDDIRFVESNGDFINYWIESKTNSSTADVWVKTDVPATGGKTIFMYYGNSTLSAGDDGENTFIFFDDFEDAAVSATKWDDTITNVTTSTDQTFKGSKSAKFTTTGDIRKSITPSDDIIIKYWSYYESNPSYIYPAYHGDGTENIHVTIGVPSAGDISHYITSWNDTGTNVQIDAWKKWEIKNFDWTNHTYDMYYDDVLIINGLSMRDSSALYNGLLAIVTNGTAQYIDCVIIQKYTANVPTTSIGSEE